MMGHTHEYSPVDVQPYGHHATIRPKDILQHPLRFASTCSFKFGHFTVLLRL